MLVIAEADAERSPLDTHRLGPFYQDLLDLLDDAASGETTLKFALFSGHDTTVGPLLAALRADDSVWPHYASNVAFELWTDSSFVAFLLLF